MRIGLDKECFATVHNKCFLDIESTTFSKSLANFVQIFFDISVSPLKNSALVACSVSAVLLNFGNAYGWWLVENRHTSVTLLQVVCAAEQQGGSNKLAETKEFLDWFSLSTVVEVRKWIPVTSSTDKKELTIRVLHRDMSKILSEICKICLQCFPG